MTYINATLNRDDTDINLNLDSSNVYNITVLFVLGKISSETLVTQSEYR